MKNTLIGFALSFVIIMNASAPATAATGLTNQYIRLANQKTLIQNFLSEFELTECFLHERETAKNTQQEISMEELACLSLKSIRIPEAFLPNLNHIRALKTAEAPSRALVRYYGEIERLGLDPKNNPKALPSLAQSLHVMLIVHGYHIPKYPLSTTRTYIDLLPNMAYRPAVEKALELNIISPISEKRIGLKREVTRSEILTILYKLSLVHGEDLPFSSQTEKEREPMIPNLDILTDTIEIIQNRSIHQNDFDSVKGIQQATKALVNTLEDPYSVYFTPEENVDFGANLSGELEGIGAYIEQRKNNEGKTETVIVSPIEGSPAEKVGLKANDIILEVDGEAVGNLELRSIVNRIKGKAGTTVKLGIRRNGETLMLDIVRAKIVVPSVTTKYPETDIAHIKVSQFNTAAFGGFRSALKESKEKGVTGVIIDLRNNPGGFLHIALEMLELILPPKTILVRTLGPSDNTVAIATDPVLLPENTPIVVLTNKGSASASEIFAGVLQENKRATLIGTTTFGKGTVQNLISFKDVSALKITTSKWVTGGGREVDKVGVTPDIQSADNLDTVPDETLDEAIRFLQRKSR